MNRRCYHDILQMHEGMVVNQPPENGTCILKKKDQPASQAAGYDVYKYNSTDGKAMLDTYSIK